MDEDLLQFALRAFVTLFVVVDPVGVAPSFVALTTEFPTSERNQTLRRAVMIASGVTFFFLICGPWLLDYLGVTVHAFAISGGRFFGRSGQLRITPSLSVRNSTLVGLVLAVVTSAR